ncbi:DNA distortion polypeptide 3 [Escherichia coli]|uniref:DNA distortion polypeptide 3 n=1 Tax=Escherichia coli TaxID=562 RepID=UPI0015C40FFC|nr:DNA distortion polypeptide 3 [Escherichia coli]
MAYGKSNFLNEKETKLLYLLKTNLSEKYAVLAKVRLSEFLYSTQPEGTEKFYVEFQQVNLVTVPFAIFDTTERKLVAVVYFSDDGFDGKVLLESQGVLCVEVSALKDIMISEVLEPYMI